MINNFISTEKILRRQNYQHLPAYAFLKYQLNLILIGKTQTIEAFIKSRLDLTCLKKLQDGTFTILTILFKKNELNAKCITHHYEKTLDDNKFDKNKKVRFLILNILGLKYKLQSILSLYYISDNPTILLDRQIQNLISLLNSTTFKDPLHELSSKYLDVLNNDLTTADYIMQDLMREICKNSYIISSPIVLNDLFLESILKHDLKPKKIFSYVAHCILRPMPFHLLPKIHEDILLRKIEEIKFLLSLLNKNTDLTLFFVKAVKDSYLDKIKFTVDDLYHPNTWDVKTYIKFREILDIIIPLLWYDVLCSIISTRK